MRRLVGLLLVLIAVSCHEQEEVIATDAFSGFFPLQVGSFSIYDVNEIQYQQNVQTHFVYELKTIVIDSFVNEEGGYTFTINRLKRLDSTKPWSALETWSARVNGRQVIVNEGNISYVRITLPLQKGQKWNGNELNSTGGPDRCGTGTTYSCDTYEITAVNEPFTETATAYEDALTVTEHNDPDLLVKNDVRKQVYAAGIGLVYVSNTVLNYCTTPPACYGTQYVDTGYKYTQTLKQSGVEK